MDVKIPDFTKLHWQLNVALLGAIFSIFSLIYNVNYIYYGFTTFVYGVVGASLLPALEKLYPEDNKRNYLVIQSLLTVCWIIASLAVVSNSNEIVVKGSNLLSSIGLASDIMGALLLWKFGLPENINRKGMSFLALESNDEKEINKAKKYDKLSMFAVLLLVLGFILQLISNYI
jgi:hypothetical protein